MRRLAPLLALLLAAVASAEGDFRAGVASVDVTPDWPVPLAGYSARQGRKSTGVHDPVKAKCIVLESGGVKFAWVTSDFIGINAEVRDSVFERIAESTGIDDDHFLVCASHTHSGPGGMTKNLLWQIAIGAYDKKLHAQMIDRLSKVVEDANAALAPAKLGWGLAQAPGLSHNRRKDGGPTDPDLGVVEVTDREGHVRAVLANFTAHPTILGDENMKVSADYPGAFQRILEERLGGGAVVLFSNGAEGDQTISAPDGKDDWERVERSGQALADIVAGLLPSVETRDEIEIRSEKRAIDLPFNIKTIVAPRTSTILVADIAGLALAAVPGEMCVEIGLDLKRDLKAAGAKQVMIVGLSNDHLGYFVTPQGWKDGGYEKDMCFYGPTIAECLKKNFRRVWRELHTE